MDCAWNEYSTFGGGGALKDVAHSIFLTLVCCCGFIQWILVPRFENCLATVIAFVFSDGVRMLYDVTRSLFNVFVVVYFFLCVCACVCVGLQHCHTKFQSNSLILLHSRSQFLRFLLGIWLNIY